MPKICTLGWKFLIYPFALHDKIIPPLPFHICLPPIWIYVKDLHYMMKIHPLTFRICLPPTWNYVKDSHSRIKMPPLSCRICLPPTWIYLIHSHSKMKMPPLLCCICLPPTFISYICIQGWKCLIYPFTLQDEKFLLLHFPSTCFLLEFMPWPGMALKNKMPHLPSHICLHSTRIHGEECHCWMNMFSFFLATCLMFSSL